jgi:hypothetical protein
VAATLGTHQLAAIAKQAFDLRDLTSVKTVWEDRKWIGGM